MVVSAPAWLLRVCGWGSPPSTCNFGGWPRTVRWTSFMATTARLATGCPDEMPTTTIWYVAPVVGRSRSWPIPLKSGPTHSDPRSGSVTSPTPWSCSACATAAPVPIRRRPGKALTIGRLRQPIPLREHWRGPRLRIRRGMLLGSIHTADLSVRHREVLHLASLDRDTTAIRSRFVRVETLVGSWRASPSQERAGSRPPTAGPWGAGGERGAARRCGASMPRPRSGRSPSSLWRLARRPVPSATSAARPGPRSGTWPRRSWSASSDGP